MMAVRLLTGSEIYTCTVYVRTCVEGKFDLYCVAYVCAAL